VMAELAADGVDVSRIKLVTDAFTPVVIALIRADGSRLPLVWPPERAADKMLEVADIDREDITGSCWLHATGMALRHQPASQAVLSAMRTAHAAGVTVSLDLNLRLELWGLDAGMRSIIEEALTMADVVFGSGEEELIPLTGEDSVEAAVTKLGGGGRTAVGRVGAAGVVAAVGGRLVAVPADPTQVVDSLGAGDAFDAGFIAARTRGLEVEDCLAWGNAVAAFNLSGRGARALPRLPQLMALMARAH
jgi:sugar/nucleoside kinase (ribokinase family)